MDRDRHVVGHVADRVVHRLRIGRDVLLGVVADFAEGLLHLRVAEHGDGGVVDLQIAAARLVQVGDLLAIALREIGPEVVEVRIGLLDRLAVAARMQHRRRRHGELGRALLHHGFQEFEVRHHARLGAAQLASDEHRRRLRLDALELHAVVRIALSHELNAVEAGDEVDVPPVAAEFAVGDRRKAEILLQLHHLANQAIFGILQLRGGRASQAYLLAHVMQLVRPEQAADVVGAKGSAHV